MARHSLVAPDRYVVRGPADAGSAGERSVDRARPGVGPDDRRRRMNASLMALLDRVTVRAILVVGLSLMAALMLLAAVNAGGLVALWEPAYTTVGGLAAVALAASAAREARGLERRVRTLVALGLVSWSLGQMAWNVQVATGIVGFPTPSDVGYLGIVIPVVLALLVAVRGRLPRAEELAVYLDSAAMFLAITAAILAVYGDGLAPLGTLAAAVTVAYPVLHLATAGAGLIALLAIRGVVRASGGYLLLAGFTMVGLAWVAWLREAVVAVPVAGSLVNYFFPIGILVVGLGGASWRLGEASGTRSRRATTAIHGALPLVALFGSTVLIVARHVSTPDLGLVDAAAFGVPSELTEDDVMVAVVVRPGHTVDAAELITFCTDRMGRHMVPRYVDTVETLPRTPTEKVEKALLRERGVTPTTWDRETT